MKLETPLIDVDIMKWLEDEIINQTLTYISKVTLSYGANGDAILDLLTTIQKEFKDMCSIRNFTLHNTNMVRHLSEKILTNKILSNYYFEVYKAVVLKLDMEFSKKNREVILNTLIESSFTIPCKLEAVYNDKANRNFIIEINNDYTVLCNGLFIDESAFKNFLSINPWYTMVMLVNFFSSTLLENLVVFSSTNTNHS